MVVAVAATVASVVAPVSSCSSLARLRFEDRFPSTVASLGGRVSADTEALLCCTVLLVADAFLHLPSCRLTLDLAVPSFFVIDIQPQLLHAKPRATNEAVGTGAGADLLVCLVQLPPVLIAGVKHFGWSEQ